MSRTTAVCVLFVVFLVVAGSYSPAPAWPGTPPDASEPTAVALPVGSDVDPDGLTAADPVLPPVALLHYARLLLGSLWI